MQAQRRSAVHSSYFNSLLQAFEYEGAHIVKALFLLWVYRHVCVVPYADGAGYCRGKALASAGLVYIPPREILTFPAQSTLSPAFLSGGRLQVTVNHEDLKQQTCGGERKWASRLSAFSSSSYVSLHFFCHSLSMLVVGEGYVQCWSSCDLARESSEQTVCAVPPCFSPYAKASTHCAQLYLGNNTPQETETLTQIYVAVIGDVPQT